MKHAVPRVALLSSLTLLTVAGLWIASSRGTPGSSTDSPQPTTAPTVADLGQFDLSFEENLGQTDSEVQFMSRGSGATYFLRKSGLVMGIPFVADEDRDESLPSGIADPPPLRQIGIHMNLEGANPDPTANGEIVQPQTTTYIRQKNSVEWKKTVRQFARVRYEEVYDGIDLVYYAKRQELEYDFVVKPGADPSRIRFSFDGADSAELEPDGALLLATELGELRHAKPYVYQEIDGNREPVEGRYRRLDDGAFTFELAEYRPDLPLVIDPAVVLSSLWGGSGFDIINAVTSDLVDAATDTEVFWFGGQTTSNDVLPSPGQSSENFDMFISGVVEMEPPQTAGLSPAPVGQQGIENLAGTRWLRLFTVVVGGGASDILNSMTVAENNGQRFLVYGGSTLSRDFPGTAINFPPGGLALPSQTRGAVGHWELDNVFKDTLLDPSQSENLPFISPFDAEERTIWEVDVNTLYYDGQIDADTFLVSFTDRRGTDSDVGVAGVRLPQGGNGIVPVDSLIFGGPNNQFTGRSGIFPFQDPANPTPHVFLSGTTTGGGVEGPGGLSAQTGTNGQGAFLAGLRYSGDGFSLQRLTALGTSGGNTFGGPTIAVHDPTQEGVHNIIQAVTGDATRLGEVANASGANLFNSWWLTFRYDSGGGPPTLLTNEAVGGPQGTTNFEGLIPGLKGGYFFAGSSDVAPQRLRPEAEVQSPAFGGYDMLMYNCIRTPNGTLRRYGYRWGGPGNEFSRACTLDHWGNIFIVGYTNGNGFPIVDGAFQSSFAGGPWDGVLVKWKKPLICAITDAASFRPGCIAPGGLLSIFGHWVGHRQLKVFDLGPGGVFSTELDGLTAYVLDSNDQRYEMVPLFGSKSQSNWVIPYEVPAGPARVCLVYRGIRSYFYDIDVRPYWPACFANNGYGAFISADGVFNQAGTTYPPGTVIQAFGTQFGTPQNMIAITESSSTTQINPLVESVLVELDPAAGASLGHGQRVAQGTGTGADVLFAGLAPGFTPGLQQVNFVVPNVEPGMYNVTFQTGDAVSAPVLIGVGAP